MGLDHRITLLLTQLGWTAPTVIVVLVVAVIAVVRRDCGSWWKLVVAGAACTVIGSLVSVLGTFVIYGLEQGYRWHWIVSVPAAALQLAGLALLGAGALAGRPGTPAPVPAPGR